MHRTRVILQPPRSCRDEFLYNEGTRFNPLSSSPLKHPTPRNMSSSNESAFHAELVDALQEIHQSDLPLFEKMRRFPMGLREDKPYFAYVLSNDDLLRQDVVKSSLARLCNELGFEWCTIRLELYASSEGDSADDWTYADEEEERMVKLLMRRHAELDTRLLCISDDHPCGAHIMPNVGLADLVGAKSLWATDPRRAFEDDAERTSIDGRIHLPFGKTRDGNFEGIPLRNFLAFSLWQRIASLPSQSAYVLAQDRAWRGPCRNWQPQCVSG